MSLMSPELLWLLAALPIAVGAYVLALRRRSRVAVRMSSLSLVRQAIGPSQRLRRHVPPVILLLALFAALLATTRPTAVVTLPAGERTIVLALDVSLSMAADDIAPNRLAAAQTAARDFVLAQPADVRIAIVSFAGMASVLQGPTVDRAQAIAAIDRLRLDRHTAIGSGIVISLAALFPEDELDLEIMLFGHGLRHDGSDRLAWPSERTPLAPGSDTSSAIILLTDGSTTSGPHPLDAARLSADRGVRVYTVGFGSAEGAMVSMGGWSFFSRFDEETLKAIAEITHGEYFHADDAQALQKVYEELGTRFVMETAQTEITALFAAAAALLVMLAAVMSLLWFGLPAARDRRNGSNIPVATEHGRM